MSLSLSPWPAGSIEAYRKLAREQTRSTGLFTVSAVAALALRARRTDLAALSDDEVVRFIDIVFADAEFTNVSATGQGAGTFGSPQRSRGYASAGLADPSASGRVISLPGSRPNQGLKDLGELRITRGWNQGRTVAVEGFELAHLPALKIGDLVSFTFVRAPETGAMRATSIVPDKTR